MSHLTYCFDLDETLCHSENKNYFSAVPILDMIEKVNYLYDLGNTIKIFTARGMGKFNGDVERVKKEYLELTRSQLNKWGVKHNELVLGKPSYDFFIDDKNLTINEFKNKVEPRVGFIAGAFDVIHPGYIKMFKEIKDKCDYVLVGLHSDPSIENKKTTPILSVEERKETLLSLKFVDEVIVYDTEKDLKQILKTRKIDFRFLGEDYKNKEVTGSDLLLNTIFIDRSHGWSATKFKKKILDSLTN